MRFDKDKASPYHVRTSGTDHGGGNTCADRIIKSRIHGIDRINRPKIGGDGLYRLIAVVPLHSLFFLRDSHVAVRFDQARHHDASGRIDHLVLSGRKFLNQSRNRGLSLNRPQFLNFSILNTDIAVFPDVPFHRHDLSTDNIHLSLPFRRPWANCQALSWD